LILRWLNVPKETLEKTYKLMLALQRQIHALLGLSPPTNMSRVRPLSQRPLTSL
jgi:hypothetical protein